MKSLDSFLKNPRQKKKTSSLAKYQKEILYMHENEYKIQVIQEFLKVNNLIISISSIYKFINQKNFSIKTQKIKEEKKVQVTNEQVTNEVQHDSFEDSEIPNFQELKNLIKGIK